jgi:hypothetical protein
MSGPSKVIVVEPDPRAARQLQLGLAREGVTVVVVPPDGDLPSDAGLVIVGGADGQATELVRRARSQVATTPIVFAGTGATRDELAAAGADEIVFRPAYLRDVVTIARLFANTAPDERDHLTGSLAETTGVYTLVRALAAIGRSAVLTLIRGLRRGEIRFYEGEVTSAQVGLIHGQAAFHQLLLWTDAHFDYQHEDIVRRQQIPMTSDELFADAEHFLDDVRESAGTLSPAMVLEQDVQRVHNLGKQIPTEVHGVLRMFDGHRVLADILEDSPYRVFETLRVTQKAMEVGLLKRVENQKPKATWRAVLAIEEWLVGKDTREAVVERTRQIDSGSMPTPSPTRRKKRRKKRRAATPPAGINKPDIDWGALVPRVIGAEVGPLSGVVPAMDTHGEIEAPSREKQREGLELLDTDKRERIFPTEIGLEPSIVVKGGDTDEWEKIEWEAKAKLRASQPGLRASGLGPAEGPAEGPRASGLGPPETKPEPEPPSRPTNAGDLVRELVAEAKANPEPPPSPEARGPRPEAPSAASGPRPEALPQAPAAPVPHATGDDEQSDGVVRSMIAVADTDQLARQRAQLRPPGSPPPDGPAVRETSGEIGRRAPAVQPTPATSEPSILVADLAAAHAAAAVVAAKPPETPPPGDAASPSRELAVSEVRKDVIAATDAEEAFFNRAERTAPHRKPESFDDLDEGYQPPKFWDKVFGRKPKKE